MHFGRLTRFGRLRECPRRRTSDFATMAAGRLLREMTHPRLRRVSLGERERVVRRHHGRSGGGADGQCSY